MNIIEGILFYIGIGGAIFFGFGIIGMVSDFIFPHWKCLNDWTDTLPMTQKDENFY